jgi:L-iditol 2-dehydrogenase
MKKIVLSDLRSLSIIEKPKPKISSDFDVLIRISSVGICGSDIHYFSTGRIGDQLVEYPHTLGHECTGVVEETGAKVSKIRVGDRIAIEPAVSCGTCDQCLCGRKHTCRNIKFLGNPNELEGAFQEYLILPEECCFKLPDTITLLDGVCIEPLTIALHAVGFNKGMENIAILGSGPIGICTFFALKHQLPDSNIFVTDKIDGRLSFIHARGASWTGNPLKVDVVAEILKENPGGIDTVFECCGQQEAITQAIDVLKPGGQLIVVGIPEEDNILIDVHKMRKKEISIHNVRRQNNRYHAAIEMLAKKQIDLNGFFSHQFYIGQIQKAFELVESYSDGVIKAVIEFGK